MAEPMTAQRLAQHQPAAEDGILAGSAMLGGNLSRRFNQCEAVARCRSRRPATAAALLGSDPRRPGCGAGKCRSSLPARSYSDRPPYVRYRAPLSSASIAEISTASLVRTSSRNQLRRRSSPGARSARSARQRNRSLPIGWRRSGLCLCCCRRASRSTCPFSCPLSGRGRVVAWHDQCWRDRRQI